VCPSGPADIVLEAVGTFPTGKPQLDVVTALERAADAFEEQGRFFYAGYAMEKGVKAAWGDGDAIVRCVRRAIADYGQAVALAPADDLAAVAALVSWTVLAGMNYLGEDPTEVRRSYLALDQVLAQRLIALARSGGPIREPCSVLVHGFRLTTDFKDSWGVQHLAVEVRRGVTTWDGTSITLGIPSAFSVLVRSGDYVAAWELAEACPHAFSTPVECPRSRGHLIAWVCPAQREGCGVHAQDAPAVPGGVPS
jgi:hypothetical protein